MTRPGGGLRPWAGAAVAAALALAACQPYEAEKFIVVNDTSETVVVRWGDGRPYATLPPGRRKEQIPPPDRCRKAWPREEGLSAVSAGGKRYPYGRPPCAGEIWHIGGPAGRGASPS